MAQSSKSDPVIDTVASDPDFMLSLARGLSVIRAFEDGEPNLTVAEVARRSAISRAAARRCLHTLNKLGYVSVTGAGYELAPKVLTLGYAYLGSALASQAAQPVLEKVSERLKESSSMGVLDGNEIVYVARAATRRILSIGLTVGTRLPAYCTSMGRVLLAFAGEQRLKQYLASTKLVPHTDRTITSARALREELGKVQSLGYALIDQELELGLRSVAVPVRGRDRSVVASINVGVQVSRVECKVMIRDYVPILREAADQIELAIRHKMT